jgi:hypothetical protein
MTGRRMNWQQARLHGRPTLDHRYETMAALVAQKFDLRLDRDRELGRVLKPASARTL